MSRESLTNLALIQVGWFVAVLGSADGHAWPGPAFAGATVILYLSRSRSRCPEMLLVLASACLGLAVDSSLVLLDLVRFAASWPSEYTAPLWTLGLWALLATAFPRSMRWLSGKPMLAAALAPVAPITYWAGARLGAAEFPAGLANGLVGIGVGWAIALPLLAALAARTLPAPGIATGLVRPSTKSRSDRDQSAV